MAAARSSQIALEDRLDRVEEMLSSGVPSGTIERKLATEYGVTRRQVRSYIQRVYQRREKERAQDAPFRRENLLRKIERFYATCLSKGKYSAAAQALVIEARLSGAFDHAAEREALLARIGPPPDDPGEMLVYTRRVLVASLHEAMTSPHLDVERRQRIVADIAFKISATQQRTEVEADLTRIEALLTSGRSLPAAAEVVDARTISRPATSRDRRGRRGPRPLRGPGSGPGEREEPDGDDPLRRR